MWSSAAGALDKDRMVWGLLAGGAAMVGGPSWVCLTSTIGGHGFKKIEGTCKRVIVPAMGSW